MVYKWKEGSRFSGDIEAIGEWIDSLDQKTPEILVNEAEDKKCPAHNCFTWDDAKAAHQHRLQEARLLVNSIVVEEEEKERPAFESVIVENTRQYVSTTIESLSDEDIWEQIVGEAKASIRSLQKKLNTYSYIRKEQSEKAQYHLHLASEAIAQ